MPDEAYTKGVEDALKLLPHPMWVNFIRLRLLGQHNAKDTTGSRIDDVPRGDKPS